MARIKTAEEIKHLREGGAILAGILENLTKRAKPGVRTDELDAYARELFKESGGEPAFLNYKPDGAPRPFPASVCVSVNDEVVHGIPNEAPRTLAEGDIVTFDAGLKYFGLYTDSAVTVSVGDVAPEVKKLMEVTKEALTVAIKTAIPGNTVGDIGDAVAQVAEPHGYGVVAELGGHGVGHAQHEPPFIPNFSGSGMNDRLKAGMVIAIEPIFNLGNAAVVFERDGYTVRTRDGSKSAHYEHTVAVTEKGAEILTQK